jgi:hypothetical protein
MGKVNNTSKFGRSTVVVFKYDENGNPSLDVEAGVKKLSAWLEENEEKLVASAPKAKVRKPRAARPSSVQMNDTLLKEACDKIWSDESVSLLNMEKLSSKLTDALIATSGGELSSTEDVVRYTVACKKWVLENTGEGKLFTSVKGAHGGRILTSLVSRLG